ncbi:unnamed protein product [marine sediment metagenome]|uniref:Uncharacterized protein n=1 Tax=marine sediment metagenome TaxID=412755 RepID=X0X036_9ZZZZ
MKIKIGVGEADLTYESNSVKEGSMIYDYAMSLFEAAYTAEHY